MPNPPKKNTKKSSIEGSNQPSNIRMPSSFRVMWVTSTADLIPHLYRCCGRMDQNKAGVRREDGTEKILSAKERLEKNVPSVRNKFRKHLENVSHCRYMYNMKDIKKHNPALSSRHLSALSRAIVRKISYSVVEIRRARRLKRDVELSADWLIEILSRLPDSLLDELVADGITDAHEWQLWARRVRAGWSTPLRPPVKSYHQKKSVMKEVG